MRPLALALLLFPAALCAQPAPSADPRAALGEAFADGEGPKADAPADAAAAVRDVQALFKREPKSPKLGDAVFQAYQKVFPKSDRDDILARARLTYGLSTAGDFQQAMKKQAQRAEKLPPDQAKVMQARLSRMKTAFGQMSEGGAALSLGGGSGNGGVSAGGRDDAARRAALEKYKSTPTGPSIKIAKNEPPPLTAQPLDAQQQKQLAPGEVYFAGVKLNQRQQSRVAGEVQNLRDVLNDDNLNGYVSGTDKKQLTDAWGAAVARHVDESGRITDMGKTVNQFRDILLQGRENGNGTTRVAEHWGEMAVGSYTVHPYAAIGASLLWNTYSITANQLKRSYKYIAGTGPLPPAGNYWGEQMNKSLVTESAAAGWASALEGAEHQSAVDGVMKTLKLDEFAAVVGQDGILTTAGEMKHRYISQ